MACGKVEGNKNMLTTITGFGAAKYRYIRRETIQCATEGCQNHIYCTACTSLVNFCAFCWRRYEIVQNWIDHNTTILLLAQGEEKTQLFEEMRTMLTFAKTASSDEIEAAYTQLIPWKPSWIE